MNHGFFKVIIIRQTQKNKVNQIEKTFNFSWITITDFDYQVFLSSVRKSGDRLDRKSPVSSEPLGGSDSFT